MKPRDLTVAGAILASLALLSGIGLAIAAQASLDSLSANEPFSAWVSLAAFLSILALAFLLMVTIVLVLPCMLIARKKRWDLSRDAVILMFGGLGMVAGLALGMIAFNGMEFWLPTVSGLIEGLIGGALWWYLVARQKAAAALDPYFDGDVN